MKLNLLPTTVSKGRQSQTALIGSILIVVASVVGAVMLSVSSRQMVQRAKDRVSALEPLAANAVAESKKADDIISDPRVLQVAKNAKLAKAMIDHNAVYPELYNSLRPWYPPYFRVTSLSATALGADQCQVNVIGTVHSYQQYADLMLALLRNPEVVTVSRNNFVSTDLSVPQLVETDQSGRPRRMTDGPIPDDPLARLSYLQATSGSATGYTGVGNFGAIDKSARSAMPGWSLVSITLVVKRNLQTPNPSETLSSAGGGGAAGGAASAFGAPGGMGMPGMPGAPGGMPGIPGAPSGARSAGGARPAAGGKGED